MKGVKCLSVILVFLIMSGCASYRTESGIDLSSTEVQQRDSDIQILEGDMVDASYAVIGPIEATVRKLTVFHKDPTKEQANQVLIERAIQMGANAVIMVEYKEGVGMTTWGYIEAKGIAVSADLPGGINTPVLAAQTSPEGEVSVFDYYGQAEEEIDTKTYDRNLWAKALVETEGDQTKRKARYIELRANQLYYESTGISLNANITENLDKQIVPLENALTATYISKYTGKDLKKALDFRKANFEVKLVQDGKEITGTFGQKGKVWGDIVDETIKFEIFATGGFSRRGTWVIDPVNNNLEGNIGSNAAEGWDLIRIQ
jgi:hypothetical protein